jgi:hypothetical protein
MCISSVCIYLGFWVKGWDDGWIGYLDRADE